MASFELDMGIDVEDLVSGFERLLIRRGVRYRTEDHPEDGVVFLLTLEGGETRIAVEPMPAERWAPMTFPPRSLVTVDSAAQPVEVERLRRDILLAFMRVTG